MLVVLSLHICIRIWCLRTSGCMQTNAFWEGEPWRWKTPEMCPTSEWTQEVALKTGLLLGLFLCTGRQRQDLPNLSFLPSALFLQNVGPLQGLPWHPDNAKATGQVLSFIWTLGLPSCSCIDPLQGQTQPLDQILLRTCCQWLLTSPLVLSKRVLAQLSLPNWQGLSAFWPPSAASLEDGCVAECLLD